MGTVAGAVPGGAVGRRRAGTMRAVALAVLAVDVATKVVVVATLQGEPPVRLLGGAVYLLHTRNTGAAFSLGTGLTLLLSLFAMAVVGWVLYLSRRLRSGPWAVALGLILGGAAGNLVDRILRSPGPLRGGVVDFVSVFDDAGQVFPVFNVADSSLVIGVCLLVLVEFRGIRLDGRQVRQPPGG